MSVFSSSMQHRSFYWQISILCFVLGILLAAAWYTTTTLSERGVGGSNPAFPILANLDRSAKLEDEIKQQRERVTELENKLAKRSDAAQTLNDELQNMKLQLGITEVKGPGILVTLSDSSKQPMSPSDQLQQNHLVHDYDIKDIVNELRAAGAEAISVNAQRMVNTSAVRCVGPVIMVNGVPIAPPVRIQAIGEADTLFTALSMAGGILEKIRIYDPNMAKIEKRDNLVLPAFTGSTQARYTKAVKPTKTDSSKDKGQR